MRQLVLLLVLYLPGYSHAQHKDELLKSIYFGGGSYEVDEEQAVSLLNWLDSIPDAATRYEVHLISHTDPIGGREYNQWLSRMRSQAVKALLLQHNIPESRITTRDWGLDNPLYSNSTRKSMALNRRVDVILYPIVY
jgi:outer membrane protein OmpA-like peptidoglycan-associated protein